MKPDATLFGKYIKTLADISSTVTSGKDLEEVLRLTMILTAKATGVEICSLWVIDEHSSPAKIQLKVSQAADPEYMKTRCLNINEGVVGHVASTSQTLIIKNILTEPRFKEKEMAKKLGLISLASLPIRVKNGKTIGVLNCFTNEPHDFTEIEVNLLTAVANQAAMAILNTDLLMKIAKLQEDLENRKRVERAKDILMRRRNMNGEEAFRWIQKRSMDSRRSMREVAEAVILSEDLGYYSSIPHALK
ncbi:MAG TPA: GAF and ANTAR domain-containing protein [Desulfobacterales bacterium]|nr:GAF and ANTAR domain-containing protein [Desulfobacterales bacterium]